MWRTRFGQLERGFFVGRRTQEKEAACARAISAVDKIPNSFPVVGGFFRHSEIVDRPRNTAVNWSFTIRALATSAKAGKRLETGRKSETAKDGEERIESYVRRHFRGVVCMPFAIPGSYTVTTASCFRYACPSPSSSHFESRNESSALAVYNFA